MSGSPSVRGARLVGSCMGPLKCRPVIGCLRQGSEQSTSGHAEGGRVCGMTLMPALKNTLQTRRPYDASVFETTIRVVGGMLTAHELSGDPEFLRR